MAVFASSSIIFAETSEHEHSNVQRSKNIFEHSHPILEEETKRIKWFHKAI